MLGPGREHDEQLRRRRHAREPRIEQHRAQRLAERRTAGLAGGEGLHPRVAQPAFHQGQLRGLARALDALEHQEPAPPGPRLLHSPSLLTGQLPEVAGRCIRPPQPDRAPSILPDLLPEAAPAVAPGLELPRFRGHPIIVQRWCPDGRKTCAVRAGVPTPDGGVGADGPHARGVTARRWNSPPSTGCAGTTTGACSDPSAMCLRLHSRHTTPINRMSRRWPPDPSQSPSGKPGEVHSSRRADVCRVQKESP